MSSIALVFEDIHLNSQNRSTLKIVLYWADVFFCVFFGVEMIMKVVAYGVRKYFTNWWCCLDFFIVTVSVISIYYSEMPHSKARTKPISATTSSSLSVLRVLRTMRALRPLRALSRFQGMRVVVDALMKAIPSIGKISWLPLVQIIISFRKRVPGLHDFLAYIFNTRRQFVRRSLRSLRQHSNKANSAPQMPLRKLHHATWKVFLCWASSRLPWNKGLAWVPEQVRTAFRLDLVGI